MTEYFVTVKVDFSVENDKIDEEKIRDSITKAIVDNVCGAHSLGMTINSKKIV